RDRRAGHTGDGGGTADPWQRQPYVRLGGPGAAQLVLRRAAWLGQHHADPVPLIVALCTTFGAPPDCRRCPKSLCRPVPVLFTALPSVPSASSPQIGHPPADPTHLHL